MPTTTESGPVPARSRRRCGSRSRHRNSHARWTRPRGPDTVNYVDPSGLDRCFGDICIGFHPMDSVNALVNFGRGASFGLSDKIADFLSPGASCTVAQNTLIKGLGALATTVATAGLADELAAARAAQTELRAARALTSAEQRTLDDALRTQKLDHIFVPKHNLDPLVQQFGSREAAMEQIIRSIGGPLPEAGPFEIVQNIGGQPVVIRGAVVDGIPRIGTVFTP